MAVPHRAGRDHRSPEAHRPQYPAGLNSNSNVEVGAHSAPELMLSSEPLQLYI